MSQIERNAYAILAELGAVPRGNWMSGPEIAAATNLEAGEINDAMSLLVDAGLVEWLQTMGTHPFSFRQAQITSRGRYELERAAEPPDQASSRILLPPGPDAVLRPPVPVGSPYGFQDEDWETVATRKAAADVLNVVLAFSVHVKPLRQRFSETECGGDVHPRS